jgi:hypothetical protein
MQLEDVQPAHCYARAQRLLAETNLVREELGRSEDARPVPNITDAQPREVYFETLAAWRKAQRLSAELGILTARSAPSAPAARDVHPGHVLELLEAVLATIETVKARLEIEECAPEPAIETARQPNDVLTTVIRINRDLSRALERPFTPTDVYRTVALASAYATRLRGVAPQATFIRRKQPADCYARLEGCLALLSDLVVKQGQPALAARATPKEIAPCDVYDLASLVLGELAFLHGLAPNAAPVHAFEPGPSGHVFPAHVDQLARTLEVQLARINALVNVSVGAARASG